MVRVRSGLNVFMLAVLTSMILLTGCSESHKEEKKAFQSVLEYQKETFPQSNKELEIKYPTWKDIDPESFVKGENSYGEITWDLYGIYTFNHKKVPDMKDLDHFGENYFEAIVELENGEYVVKYYHERFNIRGDIDN